MAKRSSDAILAMPDVKALAGKKLQTEATGLLTEAQTLKETIDLSSERLKEIKERLTEIQLENDIPNLRYGRFCSVVTYREGRSTLSKELLIDNGVDPLIIQASMKKGESYTQVEFDIAE